MLGADGAFERCACHRGEVAGLVVCDNTVRRVRDRDAGRMRAWQREDLEAAGPLHRRRDGRGAWESAIGRRLKQTGASWRVKRPERMAAPCCLHYGDPCDAYCKEGHRVETRFRFRLL